MNIISKIAAKMKTKTGLTMQQLGIKKMLAVLLWVYRWGWSTPGIIDMLGGGGRGLCAKLVKKELLASTKTATGAICGFPGKIIKITKDGIAVIADEIPETVAVKKGKKVELTPQNLRHHALVQKIVLCLLMRGKGRRVTGLYMQCEHDEYGHNDGWFLPFEFSYPESLDYQSAKEIKDRNISGKLIDAQVVEIGAGHGGSYIQNVWNVELEISEKRGMILNVFIKNICDMLLKNNNEQVAIFFIDREMMERYRSQFENGPVPIYAKNERGLLDATEDEFELTKDLLDRINFVFIEQSGTNQASTSIFS